jgi:TPR repeat protein
MYFKGEGVKQDNFKTFEWYQKAADKGHTTAQFYLGLMYFEGIGVRQSNQKALEWLGKACDNKYNDGCKYYAKLNSQ